MELGHRSKLEEAERGAMKMVTCTNQKMHVQLNIV